MNTGTIKIKGVIPQKAFETAKYIESGGRIGCGHEIPKDLQDGDVFYCTRCGQFLAVIKALPWITKSIYDWGTVYGENHCDGRWYIPVPARITESNSKKIKPFPDHAERERFNAISDRIRVELKKSPFKPYNINFCYHEEEITFQADKGLTKVSSSYHLRAFEQELRRLKKKIEKITGNKYSASGSSVVGIRFEKVRD